MLALGCLVPTVFLCGGSIALVAAGVRATGAVSAASSACSGTAVVGAVPRAPGAPARVVGFQHTSGAGWQWFGNLLPQPWPEPETADETDVVLCFEPETVVRIESCAYEDGIVVNRYRRQRSVRAVEAASGRVLRGQIVAGADPESCPTSVGQVRVYGVGVGERERESYGASPSRIDVDRELGDLVR
jgi:hypothetical protein